MSFKLLSMGLLGGAPSTPKLSKAAKPSARTETIHNELAQIRARDNFPLITIFALIQLFGQIAAYSTALSTPHSETRDWNRIFSKFTFLHQMASYGAPSDTGGQKQTAKLVCCPGNIYIVSRSRIQHYCMCRVVFTWNHKKVYRTVKKIESIFFKKG